MTEYNFFPVNDKKCELEGPYECSGCGGHVFLDSTFLDQVGEMVSCPYCSRKVIVKEE